MECSENQLFTKFINKLSNHPTIWRFRYHILIIAFITIELILVAPSFGSVSEYIATSYEIDYSYGFASRLFIGTIYLNLVSYVTYGSLYIFIMFFTIILTLAVGSLLGEVLYRTDQRNRRAAGFFVILYLVSPAALPYLYNFLNFGRMDLYLILLTILIILLIYFKNRAVVLIPIICAVCMLIHESFVFLFFPVVFLGLFYMSKKTGEKRWTYLYVLSSIVCIAMFALMKVTHLDYSSPDDVVQSILGYSEIIPDESMIWGQYFASISQVIDQVVAPDWASRLGKGVLTIILLSPLYYILVRFWQECIKNCDDNMRTFYRLCLLVPLATVPMFILAVDWDRWFAALTVVQFMMVMFVIASKESVAINSINSWGTWVESHKSLTLLMFVYILALGYFVDYFQYSVEWVWDWIF